MNDNITKMGDDRISIDDSMFEMRTIPTNSANLRTEDDSIVPETETSSTANMWMSFFDRPMYRSFVRLSTHIRSRLTRVFDFSPDYTDSLAVRRPAFETAEHQEETHRWKQKPFLGGIILIITVLITIVVGSIITSVLLTREHDTVSIKSEQNPFNTLTMINEHQSKEFVASEEPSMSTRSSIPIQPTFDVYDTETDVLSSDGSGIFAMSTVSFFETEDITSHGVMSSFIFDNITPSFTTTLNTIVERTFPVRTDTSSVSDITTSPIVVDPLSHLSRYSLSGEESVLPSSPDAISDSSFSFDEVSSSIPIDPTFDVYETETDVLSSDGSGIFAMSTVSFFETEDTTSHGVMSSFIFDNIIPSFTTTLNVEVSLSDMLYYTVSLDVATASTMIHTGKHNIMSTVTSSEIGDAFTDVSDYTLGNDALSASNTIMERTFPVRTDTSSVSDITTGPIVVDPLSDLSRYSRSGEESVLPSSPDTISDSSFSFDEVSSSTHPSSYMSSVVETLLGDFETVSSSSFLYENFTT